MSRRTEMYASRECLGRRLISWMLVSDIPLSRLSSQLPATLQFPAQIIQFPFSHLKPPEDTKCSHGTQSPFRLLSWLVLAVFCVLASIVYIATTSPSSPLCLGFHCSVGRLTILCPFYLLCT